MHPFDTPMLNFDPGATRPLDAAPDRHAPSDDNPADDRLDALDAPNDLGRATNPALPLRPSRRLGPQAIHDASMSSARSHAFTLYCHGMTSPAIAERLGVSARTIRRWLAAARADAVDESNADHLVELVRAVETQRAILLAAWEGYERERALDEAVLAGQFDRLRRRAVRTSPMASTSATATRRPALLYGPPSVAAAGRLASPDTDTHTADANAEAGASMTLEEYTQPARSHLSVRYLALAHAAQKEIARLHRLYEQSLPPQLPPGRLIVTRRPDPDPDPEPAPAPAPAPNPPDEPPDDPPDEPPCGLTDPPDDPVPTPPPAPDRALPADPTASDAPDAPGAPGTTPASHDADDCATCADADAPTAHTAADRLPAACCVPSLAAPANAALAPRSPAPAMTTHDLWTSLFSGRTRRPNPPHPEFMGPRAVFALSARVRKCPTAPKVATVRERSGRFAMCPPAVRRMPTAVRCCPPAPTERLP